VSRLRFVSYDPYLFINEKSKVFKSYLKKVEVKKVVNTFKYKADEYFCIKLKDGSEINVTKDHKFFFNNKWIEIHKILDLFDKKHYL
jgi:intein/homing endonuclease